MAHATLILDSLPDVAWFPLVCAGLASLLFWALCRLRLSRITARLNHQLEVQIQQRQRIAQELHDTLLQGFTGVGLKLEAITNQLPDSLQSTKEQLQRIMEQSDQYLAAARRSVWELCAIPEFEKARKHQGE